MKFRARLIPAGALVVALAASALLHARSDMPDAMALQDDGIGPLRLGLDYDTAARAARRVAPDTFMAGIGCGGRDEITYSGRLAGLPATAMAMADGGTVNEVEITLDTVRQAEHETACIAERDQLATHFAARFGPERDRWTVPKPVSSEHMVQVGPVVVVARWFATGRSCYVSAAYGGADG
ncbi:MAG TPA: hypothetical protein VMQ83_08320 [Gammaproteobacteria bacterium]|nr:hypothetical protein [Gammaproteobacteria bacterium]